MHYDHIQVPADGEAIVANPDHSLVVPDNPIIPFIEGDGIGVDTGTSALKRLIGFRPLHDLKQLFERRGDQWRCGFIGVGRLVA